MFTRFVFVSVCLALIAWSLNPFACCPELHSQPGLSSSVHMTSPEDKDSLNYSGVEGTHTEPSDAAKADSQLGKAVFAFSLYSFLFSPPHATGMPDITNLQVVALDEPDVIKSAFISLLTPPPRI